MANANLQRFHGRIEGTGKDSLGEADFWWLQLKGWSSDSAGQPFWAAEEDTEEAGEEEWQK